MDKKLLEQMNGQMNFELYSAYIYLSMSSYLENANFTGVAHWMRLQAKEEFSHAMKFYDFMLKSNVKPVFTEISKPKSEWKSVTEIFEDVCHHEKLVTSKIHNLVKLSTQLDEYTIFNFLQWFVEEQTEEESTAESILQRLKMTDNIMNVINIDRELNKREK